MWVFGYGSHYKKIIYQLIWEKINKFGSHIWLWRLYPDFHFGSAIRYTQKNMLEKWSKMLENHLNFSSIFFVCSVTIAFIWEMMVNRKVSNREIKVSNQAQNMPLKMVLLMRIIVISLYLIYIWFIWYSFSFSFWLITLLSNLQYYYTNIVFRWHKLNW